VIGILWLQFFLLGACGPTLKVLSEPIGALVELEDGERILTPATIESSVWPRKRYQVTVHASGYRSLQVPVPYNSRGEWVLVLVPEHGPVGTWSEEDVP